MRDINVNDVSLMVSNLCMHANIILPVSLEGALRAAKNSEKSEIGKEVLGDICHNFTVALTENIPVCQDTGMAVIFIEIGQEVHFVGGNLVDAINAGVANGYTDNHLRCSIVSDPFERVNTANNAPAIIHTTIVGGDKVKIDVCPKGFGSENMSAIKMFTPSATYDEVCEFVVETISKAGSNPCPPIVLGVGIGGDFEYAAFLAKKALCRDVSVRNKKDFYKDMELDLLERINKLGIGPQGFGGTTTALAVNVEQAPTHIAGLPVAVNVGCHVTRHASGEV